MSRDVSKARNDQPDASTELSEAARAVVRDQGDPRIDAHLAALGLAPDSEPPAARQGGSRTRGDAAAMRARVDELQAELAGTRRRMRLLTFGLAAALAGNALLALLLLLRPG